MQFYKKERNEKVARKFALFPFTIGNETRWLEMVYYEREMVPYDDWIATRFINKAEYEQRRYL